MTAHDLTAHELVTRLRGRGWTVATAESLTAGQVSSAIAAVAGCSDVLIGGVVAYSAAVKTGVLHVPSLATGLVSREVVEGMAAGVRELVQSSVAISTTGVAGPEAHDGEPVGSVWICAITPTTVMSRHLMCAGDRAAIREAACREAIALACEAVGR